MSLARFSIRNPVPILVLFLILLIIGGVSFGRLAVDLYPTLSYPVAFVSTTWTGAGPQEIENLVTRPIEQAMGTVNNLKSIRSTNREGSSFVNLEFDWGTDMNFATLQMREKLDQIRRRLPDDIEAPVVFKADPSSFPVIVAGLAGPVAPEDLKDLAEELVRPQIERLAGVATVTVSGGVQPEVQVLADPARLAQYGLSLRALGDALRTDNLNLPGGEVERDKISLLVRTAGQFNSLDDVRNLLVPLPGGGTARLGDVAEVRNAYADVQVKNWVNGRPSVWITVQKQTNANTVQVARAVKEQFEKLTRRLPAGVELRVLQDQSKFILSSIKSVRDSAVEGGLLAVLVIFLFLRSFRSTLVVSLSIPISIITTFAILFFSGLTINVMTLGGLALGVGMLVDDAIVVLENIYRHRQSGLPAEEAASFGAAEVTLAVVASTLSTMVVFLPIVFVEGIAAQLFRELALTVAFSLLASLLVSLTLIPLFASRILRGDALARDAFGATGASGGVTAPTRVARRAGVLDALGRMWGRLDHAYRGLLVWSLRHRLAVIAIAAISLAAAAALLPRIGTELIPRADTGELRVSVELATGTVLAETERVVGQMEQVVTALPEVDSVFTTVGGFGFRGGGGGQSHTASLNVRLKDRAGGRRTSEQVADDLRRQLARFPGARVRVETGQALFLPGFGGAPISIAFKGDDLTVLGELAESAARVVAEVPGAREVRTSLSGALPELQIRVDREKAGGFGLTASAIANTVRNSVSGQVVGQYRVGGKEYDIRVRAVEAARSDPAALRRMLIPTPGGPQVALGEIATVREAVGPNVIQRENQARVVSVTGQVSGRDLGSTMREIEARLAQMPLPLGYSYEIGGQSKQMRESFGYLGQALVLALVLTYLVMAAQFGSFGHPFVIMFSVPLAFVGAVLALVVTGRSLDMNGFIGVIMLVGIVVKNAIVLIDYINILRHRDGMERDAAVVRAGPTRLRPVLMTTLTTILGLIPLALGLSEGSEQQAGMATVVVGGLTLSTLLTLVVVPVVYTLFDDLSRARWVAALTGRRAPARAAVQPTGAAD